MGGMAKVQTWTSRQAPGNNQYDAWVSKLNETFGTWHVESRPNHPFRADVQAITVPELSIIDCVCDPCGGSRTRADANAAEDEKLTIQLVVSGQEYMKLGEQEAMLSEGDIFVWDNTQPMHFSVVEPLHKISLVMPLQRLKDWVPSDWRELPRFLKKSEPGNQVLTSYLRSLSQLDYKSNPMRYSALVEAAIALLIAPHPYKQGEGSQRLAQLEHLKVKIRRQLRDPDLNLDSIATSNRISLRYLHWLFEADNCTPWRFIVQERLEACKRDLINPAMRHKTITEIAFSWGFSNAAHFGRKIKSRYGLTPSELRAGLKDGLSAKLPHGSVSADMIQ